MTELAAYTVMWVNPNASKVIRRLTNACTHCTNEQLILKSKRLSSPFVPLRPPSHPPRLLFCYCAAHVPLCCVSVRSTAPDFHTLNEDGELWLVNQGLKETIRCYCVSNTSVIFAHVLPFLRKGCEPLGFSTHILFLSHTFSQPRVLLKCFFQILSCCIAKFTPFYFILSGH